MPFGANQSYTSFAPFSAKFTVRSAAAALRFGSNVAAWEVRARKERSFTRDGKGENPHKWLNILSLIAVKSKSKNVNSMDYEMDDRHGRDERDVELEAGLASDNEQDSLLEPPPSYVSNRLHAAGQTFKIMHCLYRGIWRWISTWDRRTRILVGLTTSTSLFLMIYFGMPSTLYVYLALVCVTLPASLIFDLRSCVMERGKPWSRPRTIGFLCSLLAATAVIFPYPIPSTSSAIYKYTRSSSPALPAFPDGHVYYFAMNLYDSAHLFPDFGDSLLALLSVLGPSNVFVSIYESNSQDDTKALLTDLASEFRKRGIASRVKMDDVGKDEKQEPKVWEKTNARVAFLAGVRNEALRPLDEGMTGLNGREFTRVVWLNDVFYDWMGVLELLNTHGGDFDLACAFDFIPLGFYDTWVARDVCGDGLKPFWPYFRYSGDVELLQKDQPIPMNSCWSGITAFDARYFLGPIDSNTTLNELDSEDAMAPPPLLPLRFRSDAECVSSECLLAALDIHRILQSDAHLAGTHTRSINTTYPSRSLKPSTHSRSPPSSDSSVSPPSNPSRRPRIYMNPRLTTTYTRPSHLLYTSILRSWPIVQPWHWFWQDLVEYRLFWWLMEPSRRRVYPCERRMKWSEEPDWRACQAGKGS